MTPKAGSLSPRARLKDQNCQGGKSLVEVLHPEKRKREREKGKREQNGAGGGRKQSEQSSTNIFC